MAKRKYGYGAMNGNDSAKGQGFDGSPQNIYRGGRRKTITVINKKLEEKGIVAVKATEYYELLKRIINMTESDIKELRSDEDTPKWVSYLLSSLGDKKFRLKVMEEILDRSFGKAKQSIEHSGDKENPISFIEMKVPKTKQNAD